MKRFLISRLSALGDTVCSLPAAVALKRAYPDCHISWVVDPRFSSIVDCCGAVDEVIPIKPSLKTMPTFADRFDAALDLQGLLKSALCIARAKADRKVGYHWQREGSWLFSEKVIPDRSSFHVVDQYVDVARELGGKMDRAEFMLRPKQSDVMTVRAKLDDAGVTARFLVVNAGAGWVTKRWTTSGFARVIDGVAEKNVLTVLVGGSALADKIVSREVIAQCDSKPLNFVGETSVAELVALISMAGAHLGGDTGSTHIAAALGIPAVGLYSITRPQRSCPYGQIERCIHEPEGVTKIDPDVVLPYVLEALP